MIRNEYVGKILIVEDEEAIRFFIADRLVKDGWDIDETDSGKDALTVLKQQTFDIVLLDLRLGDMNGLAVMRQLKKQQPEAQVIIMTAYASIDSAIEAIQLGVFDYLRKPCDIQTIIDCINRAMAEKMKTIRQSESVITVKKKSDDARKIAALPQGYVQTGKLVINLNARTVFLAERQISLTPTEYEILSLLAQSLNEPLSLKELIHTGLGHHPDDLQALETLRVYISRLRRKIGDNYIVTVRGGGYVLANIPLPSNLGVY